MGSRHMPWSTHGETKPHAVHSWSPSPEESVISTRGSECARALDLLDLKDQTLLCYDQVACGALRCTVIILFYGGAFSEGPLTPLVGSGVARERQVGQPAIVVRHRLTSVVAFSL